MNEFDTWRQNYDTLTFEDQVKYHNELEKRFPEQNHYHYDKVKEALSKVFNPVVLEFGTWKGDLALQAFADLHIKEWHGIEICQAAIKNSKCERVKYIIPDRFDWFNEERKVNADIIIATHFIEHISNDHFIQLAKYCHGVPVIHFESPLTDEGNDWQGYEGTHKLTFGWNKITQLMKGYKLVINHPESKTYQL